MTRPARAPLALVLLPGMDGSGELFAAFIAALGQAAVPLVVSYPPCEPLDYAALTEFARSHLPHGQPFVLLGESFSGPIAIALAASRPSGLVGLILCCTFVRNPTPVFSVVKRWLGMLPVSAGFTCLIAPFLLGASSTPALRTALRAAVARVSAPVLRGRLRAVLEVDYSTQLRLVSLPVLYLQAAQDRVVPAGAARHIGVLQPHMQLVQFRGPHLLLQAAPAETALAVLDFLGSLANPHVIES